jgi:hypothetical protein
MLALACPALAGPPYLTDDPETVEQGHWETYVFVSGQDLLGQPTGETGLDINRGAGPNLHFNLVLPAAYDTAAAPGLGAGDIELAAKVRFLHQAAGSVMPDVALYPRLFLPSATGGLDAPRPRLFVPLWAQKDFGSWSVFGGGGWELNPGPGNSNPWMGGLAVTRDVTKRLNLGVEIYGQSRSALDTPASAVVNFGVTYRITGHWSLLASGGPVLVNRNLTGSDDFYLSLEAQY